MFNCFVCERRLPQHYYMYECLNCGIWYSIFPYDPSWYGDEYKRNQAEWSRCQNALDIRNHRRKVIARKLQHHFHTKKIVSILDIGCGITSSATDIPNTQVRLYDPLFGHIENEFWPADMVLFFDSFEHFENPHKILKLVNPHLVYISIPIVPERYITNEQPFNRWGHYKPREHLIQFTHAGIVTYFDKCGYRCYRYDNEEQALERTDVTSFTFVKHPN